MPRGLRSILLLALFVLFPACEGAGLPSGPLPQAQVDAPGEDPRALVEMATSLREAVDRGEIQLPHLGDDPLATLSPAERRLLLATATRGARAHGRTLEIGCDGECIVPPAGR
jgi:hypothetical protein